MKHLRIISILFFGIFIFVAEIILAQPKNQIDDLVLQFHEEHIKGKEKIWVGLKAWPPESPIEIKPFESDSLDPIRHKAYILCWATTKEEKDLEIPFRFNNDPSGGTSWEYKNFLTQENRIVRFFYCNGNHFRIYTTKL